MQPVMKSIEAKYSGKVKVLFYDVWKDSKPAKQYGIRLIPTQVFLDENGAEFFRHEGFFPEAEIDKLFSSKGVTF
jgi:thioredoxin 1